MPVPRPSSVNIRLRLHHCVLLEEEQHGGIREDKEGLAFTTQSSAALTSVSEKSSPLNSRGRPVTFDKA